MMPNDPALAEAALIYMMETAPVLALRLDQLQRVVTANAQARHVLGPEVVGQTLREMVVDFTEVPPHPGNGIHLLSLNTDAGGPETFYFRFFPLAEGTLALGSLDFPEQERLHTEVLGLNQELNDLTRQLHLANAELRDKNTELATALARVKVLSGLLPICARCKQIRNDQGYWMEVESYLQKHSGATFTHGLCPHCVAKYFSEVEADDPVKPTQDAHEPKRPPSDHL